MSLLVDIGGGTTDIAFFTINDNQPDIHAVISFPKGLNFIFEQFIIQNEDITISEAQEIFLEKQGEESLFRSNIDKYQSQLRVDNSDATRPGISLILCQPFRQYKATAYTRAN